MTHIVNNLGSVAICAAHIKTLYNKMVEVDMVSLKRCASVSNVLYQFLFRHFKNLMWGGTDIHLGLGQTDNAT